MVTTPSPFGPVPDTLAKFKPPVEETAEQKCIAKGGKWDAANQRCIMKAPGPEEEKVEEPPRAKPTTPETFTDPRTGRASGITLPDGRTFLGLGPEDVDLIAAGEARRTGRPEGTAPVGTAQREVEIQRQLAELEGQAPVKRELDPTLSPSGLEDFPVVGPLITFAADFLTKKIIQGVDTGFLKGKVGAGFTERMKNQITPEELRTAALTEIERKEIGKGLTQSEKFGEFAEAANAGELAKFIPGVSGAERPSDNVQTVVSSLRLMKTRAINIESKVKAGDMTQLAARTRIDLIEEELQVGESRIRTLIQSSPELKFNSDGVNFIELKILQNKEAIFDARRQMIIGASSEPTDLSTLQELAQTEEDFEIPGL